MAQHPSTTHKDVSHLDLAATFLEVVPRAMRDIRSELRSHRGNFLTVPQFRILSSLNREKKTNKELAEYIGVSVPTMSRMVQSLVQEGLVEKTSAAIDRRELCIQLSPRGRRFFEKIRTKAREGLALRLESLSATERQTLSAGFSALAKSCTER